MDGAAAVAGQCRELLRDADWRRGGPALEKAVAAAGFARMTGDVVGEAVATGIWARSLVAMGRIPEATVVFRAAAALWQRTGYRLAYVRALLEVPILRLQTPVRSRMFDDPEPLLPGSAERGEG